MMKLLKQEKRMIMKNKLLAITLSVVMLFPLALIFSLGVISPFESILEGKQTLTVFEKELLGPFDAGDGSQESIALEVNTNSE